MDLCVLALQQITSHYVTGHLCIVYISFWVSFYNLCISRNLYILAKMYNWGYCPSPSITSWIPLYVLVFSITLFSSHFTMHASNLSHHSNSRTIPANVLPTLKTFSKKNLLFSLISSMFFILLVCTLVSSIHSLRLKCVFSSLLVVHAIKDCHMASVFPQYP